MNNVLIDSCFWIALYDTKGNPKESSEAEIIADLITDQNIIVPFPTLYEFVSSRLSRREETVIAFEQLLYRPNVKKLEDTHYKNEALENFFTKSKQRYGDISLVDEIIKLIMQDRNLKIDYVVSFDKAVINEAKSLGLRLVQE